MNDFLRKECKMLKALQGITYKELSEYIEIKQDSFYCWLKGYYELSEHKQNTLKEIIETLKEV
jgi:predicted transcriptional regulator